MEPTNSIKVKNDAALPFGSCNYSKRSIAHALLTDVLEYSSITIPIMADGLRSSLKDSIPQ
jgi:hypothetical protein